MPSFKPATKTSTRPAIPAPLDPGFMPAVLFNRAYREMLGASGKGVDLVIALRREVLKKQFPEIAKKVSLHVPDEKSRRVYQAVAAAIFPKV